MLHFSCGAFSTWPGYADLAGRIWDRKNTHDPRGPFQVKIIDREHPITRGMDDFQADDELYVCLTGDKKMDVLATARFESDREGISDGPGHVLRQGPRIQYAVGPRRQGGRHARHGKTPATRRPVGRREGTVRNVRCQVGWAE